MNIELQTPEKKLFVKQVIELCEKLNDSKYYYSEAEYSDRSGCLNVWVIPKEEPLLHTEGSIAEYIFNVKDSSKDFESKLVAQLWGML